MSRSRRFVADVSWSLSGQVALAVVNIALVPAMIRGLGVEGYGLYILLNSAASYLPVLSLGAGVALVKYLSEHAGANEGNAARGFLRSFILADGMEVEGATLEHGLLHIDLYRPEPEKKVKQIPIRTAP